MKRYKMSTLGSKRSFAKGANRINKKNTSPNPMRGGIRL